MLGIKMGVFSLAVYTLVLCLGNSVDADLSCLNEQGEPVDWFIGYKFPMLNEEGFFKEGVAYSYITSEDVIDDDELNAKTIDPESKIFIYKFKDLLLRYIGYKAPKKLPDKRKRSRVETIRSRSEWVVSDYNISDPRSILMRSLAPAFKKQSSKISSIFYNDDPSDTGEPNFRVNEHGELKKKYYNNKRAHAKGVLLMDDESMNGLWITHSVPRFPKKRSLDPSHLEYPANGVKYGQTFMCINFRVADSGEKIVDHLVNMRVLVYDNQVSEKLREMIPELGNLEHEEDIKGRRVTVQDQLSQIITTRNGTVLHLFSKAASLERDLYSGWIDEELQSDLYVETWRQGSGNPLDSFCPKANYHVNNVKDLKYNKNLQWSYSKDHSKWAISEVKDEGMVCIADSNRMESQFKRGGGAVCFKCSTCWDVFYNTIQDVEPCPIPQSKLQRSRSRDAKGTLNRIKEALNIL